MIKASCNNYVKTVDIIFESNITKKPQGLGFFFEGGRNPQTGSATSTPNLTFHEHLYWYCCI